MHLDKLYFFNIKPSNLDILHPLNGYLQILKQFQHRKFNAYQRFFLGLLKLMDLRVLTLSVFDFYFRCRTAATRVRARAPRDRFSAVLPLQRVLEQG